MNLIETKQKIEFVSPDPEDNQTLYARLQLPEDCFGRGYQEGNKYCVQCVVLAELDGRRESLLTFCKEVTDINNPPKEVAIEPTKTEAKPKEVQIWKAEIKQLVEQGNSKEDVVKKISELYPDLKKGLISQVYNGFYINQKRRGDKSNWMKVG